MLCSRPQCWARGLPWGAIPEGILGFSSFSQNPGIGRATGNAETGFPPVPSPPLIASIPLELVQMNPTKMPQYHEEAQKIIFLPARKTVLVGPCFPRLLSGFRAQNWRAVLILHPIYHNVLEGGGWGGAEAARLCRPTPRFLPKLL